MLLFEPRYGLRPALLPLPPAPDPEAAALVLVLRVRAARTETSSPLELARPTLPRSGDADPDAERDSARGGGVWPFPIAPALELE